MQCQRGMIVKRIRQIGKERQGSRTFGEERMEVETARRKRERQVVA